jgi:hypothetical protein
MALIEPFHRCLVYPAIFRRIRRAWEERFTRPLDPRSATQGKERAGNTYWLNANLIGGHQRKVRGFSQRASKRCYCRTLLVPRCDFQPSFLRYGCRSEVVLVDFSRGHDRPNSC